VILWFNCPHNNDRPSIRPCKRAARRHGGHESGGRRALLCCNGGPPAHLSTNQHSSTHLDHSALLRDPDLDWAVVDGLPKAAAALLASSFSRSTSTVRSVQRSAGGDTTKLLIELQDGMQVEAVVMNYDTTERYSSKTQQQEQERQELGPAEAPSSSGGAASGETAAAASGGVDAGAGAPGATAGSTASSGARDQADGRNGGGGGRGNKRGTLCVSSQVGCQMGCTFCATGG
jgi:hypothetical protein